MADLVFPNEPVSNTLNSDAMPINVDLELYKGDYVELFVVVKDDANVAINLTGYTARASLKNNFSDSTPIDFDCAVTGITGQVRIYMSSAVSSTLVAGSYIWDFEIINDDDDSRTYLAGDVVVNDEVTTGV